MLAGGVELQPIVGRLDGGDAVVKPTEKGGCFLPKRGGSLVKVTVDRY